MERFSTLSARILKPALLMDVNNHFAMTQKAPSRCAPKDFTKLRQTIQSPDRQYQAPTDNTKPRKDYTKIQDIRRNLKALNKYPKYLTRVTTNINLA